MYCPISCVHQSIFSYERFVLTADRSVHFTHDGGEDRKTQDPVGTVRPGEGDLWQPVGRPEGGGRLFQEIRMTLLQVREIRRENNLQKISLI